MCLERITKKYEKPLKEMVGYQVVRKSGRKNIFDSLFQSYFKETKKIGKESLAFQKIIYSDFETHTIQSEDFSYISGFHVFKYLKDAKKFQKLRKERFSDYTTNRDLIIKTKCRNIRIKGEQLYYGEFYDNVYVCDYITPIKEIKI